MRVVMVMPPAASRLGPVILLIAVALVLLRPEPVPPAFVSPPVLRPVGDGNARIADGLIETGANAPASSHSASLADLGKGVIAAAWFAGSKEGAADVAIRFARLEQGRWSQPWNIMSRERVQADTGRVIRKLGNPVLHVDAKGIIHLWFVSVSYGGWAGSALNHSQSADGGHTWSPVERLITSPFWNLSTLVRGAPVPLADGGLALPAYHEFIRKHPEWLRLGADGKPVDKVRLLGSDRRIQPAAAIIDDHRAVALLRDGSDAHRIHLSRTDDGGQHWTPAEATSLPNPDAGIALIRLADSRLLLAFNPQESDRTHLALTFSSDEGTTWSAPIAVESGSGEDEFSYPTLLQDEQGLIHLAYTWKRQGIMHRSLLPTLQPAKSGQP